MGYEIGSVRDFPGGRMMRAPQGWVPHDEELLKAFKQTGQLSLFDATPEKKGKKPKRKRTGDKGTQRTLFGDTKADKEAAEKDRVDKKRRKAGESYSGPWPPKGGGWQPIPGGKKGGYRKRNPSGPGYVYAYKPKGGGKKTETEKLPGKIGGKVGDVPSKFGDMQQRHQKAMLDVGKGHAPKGYEAELRDLQKWGLVDNVGNLTGKGRGLYDSRGVVAEAKRGDAPKSYEDLSLKHKQAFNQVRLHGGPHSPGTYKKELADLHAWGLVASGVDKMRLTESGEKLEAVARATAQDAAMAEFKDRIAKLERTPEQLSATSDTLLRHRANYLGDLRTEMQQLYGDTAATALIGRVNTLHQQNTSEQAKRSKARRDATSVTGVKDGSDKQKEADSQRADNAAAKAREKRINKLADQLEATGLLDKTDFSKLSDSQLKTFASRLGTIAAKFDARNMTKRGAQAYRKAANLSSRMEQEIARRSGGAVNETSAQWAERTIGDLRAAPGLVETFSGVGHHEWGRALSVGKMGPGMAADVKRQKMLADMGLVDRRSIQNSVGGFTEYKLTDKGQQVWQRLSEEERGTRRKLHDKLDQEAEEASRRLKDAAKPKRQSKAVKQAARIREIIAGQELDSGTLMRVRQQLDDVEQKHAGQAIQQKFAAETILGRVKSDLKQAGYWSEHPKLRGKTDEAVWSTVQRQKHGNNLVEYDFLDAQFGSSKAAVSRSIKKLVKQGFLRENFDGQWSVIKKSLDHIEDDPELAEEHAGDDPLAKAIAKSYDEPGALGHSRGW